MPDQVVQYFQSIGVQPRQPPKQQSLEEMVPINTQQNTNQQVTDAFNKANFFNKGSEGINPYGNSWWNKFWLFLKIKINEKVFYRFIFF